MRLRIGFDLQRLFQIERSGLYYHLLHWVAACGSLQSRHHITGFVNGETDPSEIRSVQKLLSGLPVRYYYEVPGWRSRLKQFFHPINRVDVFQYTSCEEENFALSEERLNAFLLPDLSIIQCPQFHSRENIEVWLAVFDRIREWADVVITYSEHTRKHVPDMLGIPVEKVWAIPLAAAAEFRPLSAQQIDPVLQHLGLVRGRYILSVGTLEPRKNHVLILRAFRLLKNRGAVQGHRLVFAGSRGWLEDSIFDTIRQLGLEEDVLLTGHTEHLTVLYNGAAIMVYPSFYEGFGLPPLEAMACGTPVITSNVAALPEVVGDAASLVDPRDERGLADAIEALLTDPALRRKASARGLERVRGFTWARTAERTMTAYETAYRAWKSR
jgi:glycosyltransferase involved in cell wall biosynthesis